MLTVSIFNVIWKKRLSHRNFSTFISTQIIYKSNLLIMFVYKQLFKTITFYADWLILLDEGV